MNAKKLVAGCTATLLLAGNVLGVSVQAPAYTGQRISLVRAQEYPWAGAAAADVQPDFYETDAFGERAARISVKAADANDSLSQSVWADSGSDYYFSQLNTDEKKLYIELKKHADSYMTGTQDFEMTEVKRGEQKVQVCILPLVSYEGLTVEQMKKVFFSFLFENPQYYFLRNSVAYSENTKTVAVGLNQNFANGQKRAEYTNQLMQQLAVWEEQIAAQEKPLQKERLIHDLICAHVSYSPDMDAEDPDDKAMSQSCISAVLFERSAVCTGYAQLFTLLCNRAGIPCVTVTSKSHAWNKVRIGGVWYNTDCTWNDGKGDQTYLNVTDERLLADDTQKAEHVLSDEWKNRAPECAAAFDEQQAGSSENDVSDFAAAPQTMTDIAVSSQKGKLTVQFEPAAGCDGYTVQYSANAGMEQAGKKTTEKTPCVITGLKEGKVYYVRVRAYSLDSNGNKLYGAYSNKVKITVK